MTSFCGITCVIETVYIVTKTFVCRISSVFQTELQRTFVYRIICVTETVIYKGCLFIKFLV